MKCLYFILLLSIPAVTVAQDTMQSVIGSAGGDFKNETASVSWTIGEVVTETLTTDSYILAQGFHQGNLVVNRIQKELPVNFQIKTYPNPVKDILIIESEDPGFEYQLINVHGRVISNGFIHSSSEEIDFTNLPPGTYFLQVEKHKTHKIIKH